MQYVVIIMPANIHNKPKLKSKTQTPIIALIQNAKIKKSILVFPVLYEVLSPPVFHKTEYF